MRQVLLIFVKNPVEGKVKTRLASTIGDVAALSVYHRLLQHTREITHDLPVNKILFYSEKIESSDLWNEAVYQKAVQAGSGLGERMRNAFASAFDQGNEAAVIIGSDCFELTPAILKDAFAQLADHDVVIGPALDGGYYLLGMKRLHSYLFENIAWSTGSVLGATLAACRNNGLHYTHLPVLRDIDDEKDLIHLSSFLP